MLKSSIQKFKDHLLDVEQALESTKARIEDLLDLVGDEEVELRDTIISDLTSAIGGIAKTEPTPSHRPKRKGKKKRRGGGLAYRPPNAAPRWAPVRAYNDAGMPSTPKPVVNVFAKPSELPAWADLMAHPGDPFKTLQLSDQVMFVSRAQADNTWLWGFQYSQPNSRPWRDLIARLETKGMNGKMRMGVPVYDLAKQRVNAFLWEILRTHFPGGVPTHVEKKLKQNAELLRVLRRCKTQAQARRIDISTGIATLARIANHVGAPLGKLVEELPNE